MKTVSIAICDDLPEARTTLAGMVQDGLKQHGRSAQLHFFSSGKELLNAFRPGRFHILFLDIYLPGLSGLDTARAIRAKDSEVCIIFATTSEDHGLESYDVQAADYLVKPFRAEEVSSALDWCLTHLPDALRCLTVSSNWEPVELPHPSIRYIEVLGHQSYIHTLDKTVVTRRGLDDLEEAIGSGDFLRCHRSYLVNMNHVSGLEGSDFRMDDGSLVPIRSAELPKLRSLFIDWTYRKAWRQT